MQQYLRRNGVAEMNDNQIEHAQQRQFGKPPPGAHWATQLTWQESTMGQKAVAFALAEKLKAGAARHKLTLLALAACVAIILIQWLR